MKSLTIQDARALAKLSHLRIAEGDMQQLTHDLDDGLTYVTNLSEIDTTDVPDSFFVTPLTNVMQDDVVDEDVMLDAQKALMNAPRQKDGYFIVDRILP